jgi:UDP-2-acetamido-3-amino-2,3-dideoxy-glucuronate N-acetyltransferase
MLSYLKSVWFLVRHLSMVHHSFKYGKGLKFGYFNVIEKDVVVGDNAKFGSHIILAAGTRFGNNIDFADCCVTTGACWVGNNFAARTAAVLSKSVIVEDNVFYGPGVITNHTKHVSHARPNVEKEQLLTIIGFGAIIGTQTSVVAGVKICPLAIVGGGSVIVKDLTEEGIYVGNPATKKLDIPEEYRMEVPDNAGKMYVNEKVLSHLKKYIKHLKV